MNSETEGAEATLGRDTNDDAGASRGCGPDASVGVRLTIDPQLNLAEIRIDRPSVRNALDLSAYVGLRDSIRHISQLQVRAAVITGGPSYFSSGGDVRTMPDRARSVMAFAERIDVAHQAILEMERLPFPIVAAVEGYALGAAWGIALACDVIVASRDAYFQAPFAQRGLVADAGLAWQLPRRIGLQRASRFLYLGERMTAVEALEWGLVTCISDPGGANEKASNIARSLATGPRESNALTKVLATRATTVGLQTFLEVERHVVALSGHGDDAAEGRRAFIDQRSAKFQ